MSHAPPPNLSFLSAVEGVGAAAPARPFVGLTLEETLSGSLDQLEFETGLKVVKVAPGSPAAVAGIHRGDLVVAAGGTPLEGLDQWRSILGNQTAGVILRLGVEHRGGIADVAVKVASLGGGGSLPPPLRYAERFKARVVLETANTSETDPPITFPRVARLLRGSPLSAAGIRKGTLITAFNGRGVHGAGELVRLLAQQSFGAGVTFEIMAKKKHRTVSVDLWKPPRHLTSLRIPVLFHYDRDLENDVVTVSILDLWVLALYDYRREAGTVRHRILRFFVFESGAGNLTDLTDLDRGAQGAAP